MTDEQKNKIASKLYLNCKNRLNNPYNYFEETEIKMMKWLFASIYSNIISDRGSKLVINDKERHILAIIFDWMICSDTFQGDVKKGIYLMSSQGFGKDIILKSVIKFFAYFEKYFKEYTFREFNSEWFEKNENCFLMPIKINDIDGTGKIKRERSSIPFLEFLDFREQINSRRGIIISTNFGAKKLQDTLEFDSQNPRLYERIKEVFNIIIIDKSESKRVENKIVI